MKSVAHNGFGCPYCRSKMAEEVANDDDSYFENEYEEEIYEDNALTSLRMFHQRLSGEEVEEEPEEDQEDEEESVAEEEVPTPSPAFIARKLTEQGVTMEQLVKCLLLNQDHDEYSDEKWDEELNMADRVMFGKFRMIISNYSSQQQEQHENM
jgi:hypothetical protein